MAYCNIEDSFLGKKLDSMFYDSNRNTLSNLVASDEFKEWFNDGRRDIDGNPLIDEELSFTSQDGEKKTIFDFPIDFGGKGEVYRLLESLPSVRLYNGQLFVNNVVKTINGDFLAKMAVKAVNVINYYYPDLLSFSTFQKGGIALPTINIGSNLVKNNTLFSYHEVNKKKSDQFNQLRSVDELIALKDTLDEYRVYGVDESKILALNQKPSISETTYEKLKSFVKLINPNFNVELVDNLSQSGIAYINEFLIQLDSSSPLQAMPEEVSHFFVELLPIDHPLRKDMMDNITSFLIYSTTLNTYKNLPEYQIDGKVNYDKIKREAIAKLIGEFVYAISENDNSRLEILMKTKDSFIKRWWDRFVNWLMGGRTLQRKERFEAYKEAAEAILFGNVDYLTMEDIERNAADNVYFSVGDTTLLDIELTQKLLSQVSSHGNIEKLQDIITRFRLELKKNFIKIVKEEGFEELKLELQKDEKGNDTEINYLSELYDIIKKIDIREKIINNTVDADNQILNFSQFLHVIQNMNRLAEAINILVDMNAVDGKLETITELQTFREIYSNFKSFVGNDMSKLLADSDVSVDIIAKIKQSINLFAAVEEKILDRLRRSYEKFLSTTIAPYNAAIINNFSKEIEDTILYLVKNDSLKPAILKAIQKFKDNIQNKRIEVIDSENELKKTLKELGISEKILNIDLLKKLFGKVSELYSTDMFISDFMNGLGKSIDPASEGLHMVTAAIKNHDVMIANIAKFIVDKRTSADHLAMLTNYDYARKVSPIIDKLKRLGLDEYKSGEMITYIDEVEDLSVDKTGRRNFPDGRRKIVKFMFPTKNTALIERDRLFNVKNTLMNKLYRDRVDPNSPEGVLLMQEIAKARREYIDFNDKYMNSAYTKEYRDFQKNWEKNEEFLEIKEIWNKISGERTLALETHENDKNNTNAYSEFLKKTRERSELLSTDGKSEDEIRKINLLKEFFEGASKFRVPDERQTKRNFNAAVNRYKNKLELGIGEFLRNGKISGDYTVETLEGILQDKMKDPGIRIVWKYKTAAFESDNLSDSAVYTTEEVAEVTKILVDEFKERNRVKVRTQAYNDFMDQLNKDIEDLKAKKGLSNIDIFINDLWEEQKNILIAKTDIYGQKNPATLTDEQLNRLDELEDTIDFVKSFTRGDYRIYKILDSVKSNKKFAKNLKTIEEYERLSQAIEDHLLDKKAMTEKQMSDTGNRIAELNFGFEQDGIITKEQQKVVKQISDKYKEMASLSEKKPTEAYWDKMEEALDIFDRMMEKRVQSNHLKKIDNDKDNVLLNLNDIYNTLEDAIYGRDYKLLDELINDERFSTRGKGFSVVEFKKYVITMDDSIPDELYTEDERRQNNFFKWFIESHRNGVAFKEEKEEGTMALVGVRAIPRDYTRRLYYAFSDPSRLKDDKKNLLYEVKEAKRYRETKISDNYIKPQVTWKDSSDMEDWTVGNKGEYDYLPLSKKQLEEEGKTDFKYVNEEYHTLKDDNSDKGKLLKQYLQITLNTYLNEQENKPDTVRGFVNLPVTNIDKYQSDKAYVTDLPDRAKRIGQKFQNLFMRNTAIDAEDQLDGLDEKFDINEFNQRILEKTGPALGMNTKLPIERVNRNVLHAIGEYMYASKDFDARSDLNPLMKGLLDVMKANEELGHRNQKNTRVIFDQIYKQMILEEMPDNITNSHFFRKTVNTLLSMSGVKLMADGIGGGINYLQANMNNLIESWAGQHATLNNYRVGYTKATLMIGDLLSDFNKMSDFSYWTLMYQNFDFIQGDWKEDMMERTSTKAKNYNWRNMLMYPRKNGELHAQSAMAIAILDGVKVLNKIDGKMYPMWDIYTKKDGVLTLKEGFYEEVEENGVTIKVYPHDPIKRTNPRDGKEFERVKQLIHGINIDLHGNYAKLNQTEASRHSIGKLMENMKRWFVSNLQRRMGREGIDVSKEDLDQGYYTTFSLALWNIGKEFVKGNRMGADAYFNYYWNTPRKSQNLRRTFADAALALGLFLVSTVGFGYDSTDPDKNKKLRNHSWLYNESLLLFLRTYAEHTAFIPVPPFGFTEMTRNLMDPFSVAKSTLGNAAGAAVLMMFTVGSWLGVDSWQQRAFYQRDSGAGKGPGMDIPIPGTDWSWRPTGKKGDYKLINYMSKLFGYNGAQADPAFYLRNFENLQNRLK